MQSHAVVFHELFLLQTKENRKAAVLNSLMQIHFCMNNIYDRLRLRKIDPAI